MAWCSSCGAKRGHFDGCVELAGRQGRQQAGRKPLRGGKAPNCPVCGKTMVKFENPDRYLCTTSEKEHQAILKAAEASEQSRPPRQGRGYGSREVAEPRGVNIRDRDKQRKEELRQRKKGR